jgi:hypothetical protein
LLSCQVHHNYTQRKVCGCLLLLFWVFGSSHFPPEYSAEKYGRNHSLHPIRHCRRP